MNDIKEDFTFCYNNNTAGSICPGTSVFFKLQVFTDPQQWASILAMILLPFLEGSLLVATASLNKISSPSYRIFMPWVPILFFFLITFLFHLEDCACWIIGLPLYLLLSSSGGLAAGYFRLKKTGQSGISGA